MVGTSESISSVPPPATQRRRTKLIYNMNAAVNNHLLWAMDRPAAAALWVDDKDHHEASCESSEQLSYWCCDWLVCCTHSSLSWSTSPSVSSSRMADDHTAWCTWHERLPLLSELANVALANSTRKWQIKGFWSRQHLLIYWSLTRYPLYMHCSHLQMERQHLNATYRAIGYISHETQCASSNDRHIWNIWIFYLIFEWVSDLGNDLPGVILIHVDAFQPIFSNIILG